MWQNTFFKHKYIYIVIMLCIFSFYLLAFGKGRSILFTALTDFFSPIMHFTASVKGTFSNGMDNLSSFINIKKENEILKKDIDELRMQNEKYSEVAKENERLLKMLDFKKESKYKLLAASVIGREPTNLFFGCIIDKGMENGVKKNMVVITSDGIAGKITSTTAKISKVMFMIDPNHRISAIDDRTRSFGIVWGIGKNYCMMRYLSIDEEIAVGDKIISAGEGGVYPKGIPIGRISEMRKSSDGSSWHIEVQPNVTFSKIEEAFVIIPK